MGKFEDKDQFRRIFALGIMLFSGIGLHIFQFSASLLVWMAILFILNFKNIIKIPTIAWFRTMIFILVFILVFIFKESTPPYFVTVAMISALFALSNYFNNKNLFFSDFSKLLQFYMYYALLAIPIMMFGTSLFNQITLGFSKYYTFYFLFWFHDNAGPSFFNGFRPSGLMWEAGIWQLFLNLNLLFAFYENRSIKKIFLAIIAPISVFSTTGILTMCFILLLYFFYLNNNKNSLKKIILPLIIIIVISYPFLSENINEKLFGKYSGSGMTRISDTFTGIKMLKEFPFFGADIELATASNNPLITAIKESFWQGNYDDGSFEGYMTVSNSNGVIIFLLDWGLPIGLYLLYRSMRNNLFVDRRLGIVVMLTIYFSMFSEAISRTSFFYFFIFSVFLLTTKKKYIL